MTVFSNPTFTSDFQGLCNYIATTLNRQDLTTDIPNFVSLATSRISRDMARIKHPSAITTATITADAEYENLPADFLAVQQIVNTDETKALIYITPDQSITVQSQGWDPDYTPLPIIPPYYSPTGTITYYTIIGNQLRFVPAPDASAPYSLKLWYFATLPALTTTSTTNWVLTRYPDLYLYGALTHTAPYLKNDERIALWDGLYNRILGDIEVEADRAVRSQTKLVSARRSF